MADSVKPEAAAAPPPEKKPGFSMKTMGIVGGIMLAEAAGVFMVARMTSPKPAEAAEAHVEGAETADHEATKELALIEEKFQNMQTGRVWIWDSEIVLKVKAKNEEYVGKVLENKAAEIKEGVAMIFRRAQHSQLKEPGLETINRQIFAYVNQAMGKDAEGHDRVVRVVIPKCRGFPGD